MQVRREGKLSRATGQPSFLAELPADLQERVHEATECRQLTAGEIFALEEAPCPGLCVVESGLVKVFKLSADGREQVLLLARPGESFADASAFTGQPMLASVAAVEPSTIRILPTAALDRLLDEDPRFARAVIRHLSVRLQHVVSLVEDLSFRHVQARVAKVLLQSLRPQSGIGAGIGQRQLTQREIAEMVGTAREVVSRTLGAFTDQGLIRIDRGQIELLDPAALAALL
ncbi:MAG TPA: Crp/Fnr family transcriptional regulator [Chloroflexota bacterium]|nr:Crp/Fnr family transcriptional regulator [Chloroflexota bacterium]